MLGLGVRIKPRFSGVDEAQQFAERVTAAGGTLSYSDQYAISTLVSDFKTIGVWNKMKGIYPFVGASKNLFSYTEDFSVWENVSSGSTIVKNSATAPDGTTTASLFTKNSGSFSVFNVAWPGDTFLSTQTHTYSIYVKDISMGAIELRFDRVGGTKSTTFNFSTKSFSGSTSGASYEELPDGWFRLMYTSSVTAGWTPDFNFWSGGVGGQILAWGAQLEVGSVATLYEKVSGNRTTMATAACAQNLKSSSYTGSFSSGWKFAKENIISNGTSAIFNTNLKPFEALGTSYGSHGVYLRNNAAGGSFIVYGCGKTTANGEERFDGGYAFGTTTPFMATGNTDSDAVGTGSSDNTGTSIATRQGATSQKFFKNGTLQVNGTRPFTANPNVNFYLGATNRGGTPLDYNIQHVAFLFIGESLTNTEVTDVTNAIQKFQTTVFRELGTPIFTETDANAFSTRVTTAGGSLSNTEKVAAQRLVLELKQTNLWTKMHAMYPMLGASAAACAQNLKSSSYTASFTTGMTYAAGGITGNAANAYMDTNFTASSGFSSFNSGASIYSRTNISDTSYDYGYTRSGNGHNVYLNYSGVGMRWQLQSNFADRPSIVPSGTDSSGFFVGVTGASNDRRMYKNSALLASNTNTSSASLASDTLLLCAQRAEGTPSNFSQRQYAFFALHTNLTAREVNLLSTIHRTFQNILSRW